jgi:hypothetical protein
MWSGKRLTNSSNCLTLPPVDVLTIPTTSECSVCLTQFWTSILLLSFKAQSSGNWITSPFPVGGTDSVSVWSTETGLCLRLRYWDWSMFPSPVGRQNSSIDWVRLNSFHVKTETEFGLRKVVFWRNYTTMNPVQNLDSRINNSTSKFCRYRE